jgi:hypothetical protein
MEIDDLFFRAEQHILNYLEDPNELPLARTLGVVELEKELHRQLKPWAKDHKRRYKDKGMGTLPYVPALFHDQMINVPGREAVQRPLGMSEKVFTRFHRLTYAKAVGSAALANEIVHKFQTVPAFPESSQSLADFTIESLENAESIAIATGHLDRLSDISDFTDGLNLAIIEKLGLKYADRFKVVVNKLMTRETLYHVPVPNLLSVGIAPRWGLPLAGAEKWGVSTEAQDTVNGLLAKTLVAEQRQKGQVVGIVPAGSAAIQTCRPTTDELVKLTFPHSAATSALFARYDAIIPANRWGTKIAIGSVILSDRPKGTGSKQHGHEITDHINYELALQASELAGGIPVEYARLASPGMVAVGNLVNRSHVDGLDDTNL